MIKSYLQTALRKIVRNKSYALINAIGLSLGIGCSLIIFLIIRHETSFDTFHTKRDRIYRVTTDEHLASGIISPTGGSPFPMEKALRQDFSAIEKTTKLVYVYGGFFSIPNPAGQTVAKFQENTGVVYLATSFFELFDFEWIAGNPSALAEPLHIVLTESMAKKYFPDGDAVNKIIRFENRWDLKVSGILKDFPFNTDFPFQCMISLESVYSEPDMMGMNLESWGNLSSNVNTFVLLSEGASSAELEAQLPALKTKYMPDDQDGRVHHLQPLSDMHYNTDYGVFSDYSTSKNTLWTLGLIGVFLIVTACINFINLATAQAESRSKEVGVRKVLGAFRGQLVSQFLGETFLITIMAVIFALGLTEVLMPRLLAVLGIHMDLHLFADLEILLFVGATTLTVSLLAGLYPAFVLSSFQPAAAIKGQKQSRHKGMTLRRGLVIAQFAISQTLIIGTIIVSHQMDYFQNRDMGFQKDAIVTFPLPANDKTKLETFRTQLMQHPGIRSVSFNYSSAISGNRWDAGIRYEKDGHEQIYTSDLKFADENYLETYGLELLAGRNYTASDSIKEFVVNETFVRGLGFDRPDQAIGFLIKIGSRGKVYKPIVGVVKDFNTKSLHEQIRPCLMSTRPNSYYEGSVKLQTTQMQDVIPHLEKYWNETFPEFVFSYEFLDQRIASFYRQEEKASTVFRIFALIAILIGSLGLFGLVSFVAMQRTKEIGIRKVLGATIPNIVMMFIREFFALIAIAFMLAAPLAYWVMNNWLENFAYRVSIGAGVFVTAIAFTVILAVITIGYRILKTATSNPVEALKYE
ncbi:ABC transporter permease [bacterium]|nr:ABC transporter permease [bacterium]